jgi:hypothetical protein
MLLFYHIKQQAKPITMETYTINTDPKENIDFDGAPYIHFSCDTFQLSNGETHTRYDKQDCRKEYGGSSSYQTREKWEAAIKRAKKQFAAFN